MNTKQVFGIIAILVGVALIMFSRYEQGRVSDAKKDIHTGTSLLPKNPIEEVVTGSLEKKASQYDTPLQIFFIGGIALVVLGLGVLVVFRRR